jgi:hypothetical protein
VNRSLRSLGRRLLPSIAAERAIKYERAYRASQGVPEAARTATSRLGRSVLAGPFAGLRLDDDFEDTAAAPILKLLGLYESQLHAPIERAIADRPTVIVNVGSAEGYYAVGLARRLQESTVHAYDLARTARSHTRRVATLNNVPHRVHVHGRCRSLPSETHLVICDIEGDEEALLDPTVLRDAAVIVETHDSVNPGVTSRLQERFAGTHSVELLGPRKPETDLLDWLGSSQRALLLSEMRSGTQAWLTMWPR